MKKHLFFIILLNTIFIPVFAQDIATGNNQFSFDFYKHIMAGRQDNVFASPFSVSSAFAMVYAGASGETLDELSKTLYFSKEANFHEKFANLQQSLQQNLPKDLALEVANALWIKENYDFQPDYKNIMQKYYKAQLEPVNFDNPQEACDIINAWTSKKTNDKIKKIVSPSLITDLTRLILTNAIYFKAQWATAFDKKRTQKMDFEVSKGTWVGKDFMRAESSYQYAENNKMQMIEIPYSGGTTSMVVVLPQPSKNIADFEKEFTFENYKKWAKQMTQTNDIHLYLPTFKIENDFALNSNLEKMGIRKAFTQSAEFNKIIKGVPLCISQVLHKSFVEVKEEGTEAAAVTAIIMAETESAKQMPDITTFLANRPFIFLIKDKKTDSILFMGKVMNPNK